jgi:hypothetical protein
MVLVVIDGVEQQRLLDHLELADESDPVSYRPIPVLNQGEFVGYVVGDTRPHIYRTDPGAAATW